MDYIMALLSNDMLLTAVCSWAAAQIIKTVINLVLTKSFDPGRLIGSGGMPSSHSAFVTGLATSAFIHEGPASPVFAVCFVLAFVVMYDAMGVRRETGKQAELLNQFTEIFSANYDEFQTPEETLKVLVGHTPLQVFFGLLLGIIVGIIV
ncbi:MAG: divergent PAP2 family protein [Lachnospiraceae bacterium]|nr:divergent PAP2 family protein [Lachnospiraceae bacterium]MBR1914167.1 divergent PAP2 family protein [Lachnospiraceae bacterium]